MSDQSILDAIVARKRREVERRRAHASRGGSVANREAASSRSARARSALRRAEGAPLRVIAEIKFESPSSGIIRRRRIGEVQRIARAYEAGGAAAVSVLADGPGFNGCALDVRRVAESVAVPVLFKEFVLDRVQARLARCMGASLVLLLVRVLPQQALLDLVSHVRDLGMEPVVEAASDGEVDRALATGATIIGVNARDLGTFRVDPVRAGELLERIPRDRIAVFMSGIRDEVGFRAVESGRADAALVGEWLMRQPRPEELLRRLVG